MKNIENFGENLKNVFFFKKWQFSTICASEPQNPSQSCSSDPAALALWEVYQSRASYSPSELFWRLVGLSTNVSVSDDLGVLKTSETSQWSSAGFLKKKPKQAIILCHDPYVKYWEEQSLNIDQDLSTHLSNLPDIVIISTGHTLYKNKKTIDVLLTLPSAFIYDTIGLLSADQINILKQKHTVKVLGRGDL